jgi:predicted short-subunit dehydrogenase-like oxidoreductase (DUF2520 family)
MYRPVSIFFSTHQPPPILFAFDLPLLSSLCKAASQRLRQARPISFHPKEVLMKTVRSTFFPIAITLWGAGRLGSALCEALRAQPNEVALWSRRTHDSPARFLSSQSTPSELWLITVSDDAIGSFADQLAKEAPILPKVALHCSGRCAVEDLAPLRERGVSIGVMHPLLPITPRTHTSAVAKTLFSGAYIGVDGEETAVQAAQEIAQSLGGTVFSLHGIDRALYHAAAVIASNFLVTLAAQATKTLQAAGYHADALPLLLPLMQASLHNLHTQGLPLALTGPYPRGDYATIEAHLRALQTLPAPSDPKSPSLRQIYTLLAQATLPIATEQATQRHLDTQRITALHALLDASEDIT